MLAGLALALLLALLSYNALFSFGYSVGPNYRNVSIDTRVNITNAAPEILLVSLPTAVTLSAGASTAVECNVSARDWNGYGDINVTNATLYHSSSSSTAADDNNTHYTDPNCTRTAQNGAYANYTCSFPVEYYALNGTWTCNATVTDNSSFNDSSSNTTTVNQLLALNVTSLIDYGNMAVGDTTATGVEANVTNFGNQNINISVKGYGSAEADGLAFVCQVGNITIDNERFSLNQTGIFTVDYTSLGAAFQQIPALTMLQQTNDSQQVVNSTYWKLYVPPNPFGQCNGTVVFQAEAS